MKSAFLSLFALLLLGTGSAFTQDNPAVGTGPARPLVVSGRVSQDGKMLLMDIDSAWTVANRDAVKGLEGVLVRVKCFVNTEKNSIQILTAQKLRSDTSFTATRYSDSAFRR